MSEIKYALLFVEGVRAGEAYPLVDAEVTLGRSRTNNISLDDELISRRHLAFRPLGDDLVLEDLDSAHGTFLNEKRLRGILSVSPGDMVVAGAQKIKVVLREDVAGLAKTVFDQHQTSKSAADVAQQDEEEDTKTQFGGEEDLAQTLYHQAQDFDYEEESDDAKTRVLADQATRMLDLSELHGLKPGKGEKVETKKLILGFVLLVLLLAGGGLVTVKYVGDSDEAQATLGYYTDTQYRFSLTYPAIWEKTSITREAIIAFESIAEGRSVAFCKVFADQSHHHEITGLSVGFQEYQDVLKQRHPGYRLKGQKTLDLNGVRYVQFGYATDREAGLGVFTYNGPLRFVIEALAEKAWYYTYKQELLNILGSFKLDGNQIMIDFPLADEAIRHQALRQPAVLEQESWSHVMLAQDLMKRRQVRLDNLYRSAEQYRTAMQKAAALNKRPEFYEKIAYELVGATQLLNDEIAEQKYKITMAEKIGDLDAAVFELSKLMRMIPDKNDPVYQDARYNLKWYGAL